MMRSVVYGGMMVLSVWAVSVQANGEKMDCANPQATPEINFCAEQAYQKVDKELNKVYQALLAKLHKKEKPLLIKAQKTWLLFREQHCDLQVSRSVNTTGFGGYLSECRTSLTKQRIASLEETMKVIDQAGE